MKLTKEQKDDYYLVHKLAVMFRVTKYFQNSKLKMPRMMKARIRLFVEQFGLNVPTNTNTYDWIVQLYRSGTFAGFLVDYPGGAIEFLNSGAWKLLKLIVYQHYPKICMNCERGPEDCPIHIDHIKPRSKYPNLELNIDNLQVLCQYCNGHKGLDETDYRELHLEDREKGNYSRFSPIYSDEPPF